MRAIKLILKLCLGMSWCQVEAEIDQPIVETDSGLIIGSYYTVEHLNLVGESFLGIPYAKPPIGDLRFRYPVKVERWKDTLNCSSLPNSCFQVLDNFFGNFPGATMWNPNTQLSEDCLYLNIWTPRSALNPPGDLAVLVWIFGGGFYSGTSTLDIYDGRILASVNDVIVVSISYRLGVLGFFCLDDASAPCNVGMFDQLMAIEWIKRNIKNFGGDPNRITLWGESAGAASVHLHLLSPLSRDLFSQAILQSGTANSHWATTGLEEAMRRSREFAINYMNCDPQFTSEMLADCLRGISAYQLIEQQWVSRGILQFPFIPAVDGVFLVELPSVSHRYQRFKKCPVLIGNNLNEATYFMVYELAKYLPLLYEPVITREIFLESIRQLFFHFPQYRHELNSTFLLDAIAFHYTDWVDPDNTQSNIWSLDNALSDCYFICPSNEAATSFSVALESNTAENKVKPSSGFSLTDQEIDQQGNPVSIAQAMDQPSVLEVKPKSKLNRIQKLNTKVSSLDENGDSIKAAEGDFIGHITYSEPDDTDTSKGYIKVAQAEAGDSEDHSEPALRKFTGTRPPADPMVELNGEDVGVYSYYFTERYRSSPWPQWMGVLHADEILFTFGFPLSVSANFTDREKQLSRVMMKYWANFAKTGDPNRGSSTTLDSTTSTTLDDSASSPQLMTWPRYSSTRREYLELNTRHFTPLQQPIHQSTTPPQEEEGGTGPVETGQVERGLRAKSCAFWSEYIPKLLAGTAQLEVIERERKKELERWTNRYHLGWFQFSFYQQSQPQQSTDECDEH